MKLKVAQFSLRLKEICNITHRCNFILHTFNNPKNTAFYFVLHPIC